MSIFEAKIPQSLSLIFQSLNFIIDLSRWYCTDTSFRAILPLSTVFKIEIRILQECWGFNVVTSGPTPDGSSMAPPSSRRKRDIRDDDSQTGQKTLATTLTILSDERNNGRRLLLKKFYLDKRICSPDNSNRSMGVFMMRNF